MRRLFTLLIAAWFLAALVNASTPVRAQTPDLLAGVLDGGFESEGEGWLPINGDLTVSSLAPVRSGAGAAHFVSTSSNTMTLGTQYWLVPAIPGQEHTARVWLYDNDPNLSAAVELMFTNASGHPVNSLLVPLVGDANGWREVATTAVGESGTAYVRISIYAYPTQANAVLHIDDVTLTRGPAPPPPTPSPSPNPTAAPTATAAPSPSPTPATTSTATPGPSGSATPAPTAAPGPSIYSALWNGNFEVAGGLDGWGHVGGEASVTGGFDGSSQAARLDSTSDSTKWLQQSLYITPGSWYAGSAQVKLETGVDAAWLRIAWYASDDASGSQLSVADSSVASGPAGTISEVRLDAVQAPPDARSARVRLMLRPFGAGTAVLLIDNVQFFATSAPPPPEPTATPAAPAGPAGAPPSVPVDPSAPPPAVLAPLAPPGVIVGPPADSDAPAATSDPAVPAGTGSTSIRRPSGSSSGDGTMPAQNEGSASEILVRITEVMPNPPEEGSDADFEWVELTNIGSVPVSLNGFVLKDNVGSVPLPDVTLQPGASLVLAGPRSAVPEESAYWPPGGIGNGLGNGGDRLALFAADGRLVDALSYGSDSTYDDPPLPAPPAGRSLRRYFADDGTMSAFEVSATPSPGRIEPPPPQQGVQTSTSMQPDGPQSGDAREPVHVTASSDGEFGIWKLFAAAAATVLAVTAAIRLRRSGKATS